MLVKELRAALKDANPDAKVVVTTPHRRRCEHREEHDCRQFDTHFDLSTFESERGSNYFPLVVVWPSTAPALGSGWAVLPQGRVT